jgi:maltooligosyltrehalose trehalohydrolase
MLQWYAALIGLRHTEPDLRSGDLRAVRVDHDDDAGWVVMRRGALATVANLAQEPQVVQLGSDVTEVLATFGDAVPFAGAAAHTNAGGGPGIRLDGHGAAVVRLAR